MPAYVFIWENNTLGHRKVDGFTWPGHAAMCIGSDFTPTADRYVSWWPGGDGVDFGTKAVVKNLFGADQPGLANVSLARDITWETYLPDHVIALTSDTGRENQMAAAWAEMRRLRTGQSAEYKSLRQNCSTMVSRVLHEGGYNASKWALNWNVFWTPADVRELAVSAGGIYLTWARFRNRLVQAGQNRAIQDIAATGVTHARSGAFCSIGVPCRHQGSLAGTFDTSLGR